MKAILKRAFQIISLGTLSIISCKVEYGMPVDIDYYKAVKTKTENNIPIKGLSVKLIINSDTMQAEFTNNEGVVPFNFDFYIDEDYSVLIEDIDGEENSGNFTKQTVPLINQDTTNVTMKTVK